MLFVYVLVATILMAIAWGVSGGPWTQGDTVIGVFLLLVMVVLDWD